jgi:hypothetical protein
VSPLQRIAMGLVIVIGNAYFPAHPHPSWRTYDGLADPIGWLLVLAGLAPLMKTGLQLGGARLAAIAATLVSVPLWIPDLRHHLDASGEWALSLPQTLFCFLLAKELAEQAETNHPDPYIAKRFGPLMWAFAVVAVAPAVVIGGSMHQFDKTTLAFAIMVGLTFVYFLFRIHRRTWLGGAGPVEVGGSTAEE